MKIIPKLEWRRFAGRSENKQRPIHNWFVYHHSFGGNLVSEILDELGLKGGKKILDPFCGCGTTLLVCKEKGINSVGMDLMPLSVMVSRAKTQNYNVTDLQESFLEIQKSCEKTNFFPKPDIAIIRKAFSQESWDQIQSVRKIIKSKTSPKGQDFFLTALLSIVPKFGAYLNDGGFPRLLSKAQYSPRYFKPMFLSNAARMIEELKYDGHYNRYVPKVIMKDARKIPTGMEQFDAVICSPPYPNRQDYTRVYSAELGTAFIRDNYELKQLRKRLFRSHIEAKPSIGRFAVERVKTFRDTLEMLHECPKLDKRVPNMLIAYFQDIEETVMSTLRVLKPHGVAALVVGNVRFSGIMIPVDEIVASIGKMVGFLSQEIWVIRNRGNSPQQMERFGKMEARESVVILQNGPKEWV